MKIAFVVPYLSGGGAERAVSAFSSLLSSDNSNSIYLFAFYDVENKYGLSEKVHYIPVFKTRQEYKSASNLKKISIIKKTILKYRFDVLIPFVTYVGYTLNILLWNRKFAFIETIRTSPSAKMSLLKRILRNYSIYHSDGVIFQTAFQLSCFNQRRIKNYLLLNNPIYVNRNMVANISKVNKFVYVGRFVNEKNPLLLLKAFKTILMNDFDCSLDMYGEGPLLDECVEYCKKENIIDKVSFHGFISMNKETLSRYDSLVISSDVEGMPNSLLEAMSCGIVCICSNCNKGITEIVKDGIDGFLFEKGNQDELVKIMQYVLSLERAELQSISENAIAKIENEYSPNAVKEKLQLFLEKYEK